jgi:hypothetical protein
LKRKISWPALIIIGAVSTIGVALLIGGQALTPAASIEPEKGSRSGAAAAVTDNAASGGQAIAFGSKISPATIPAKILDLANWKITLPVDTSHSGSPDEITQPELATFVLSPYFYVDSAGDGVVFMANAGGFTTSSSSYPRSELREMTSNGSSNASWSNTSGTHTMVVKEAFTHLPDVKPHVVGAQIHDASDDVIEVRLEGSRLFVDHNGTNLGDLNTNYALGTTYTLKIVAANGHIQAYYNDVLKVDYTHSGSGWYFKAGCYTQSNTSKGDLPSAYGEVVIYSLQVTHN